MPANSVSIACHSEERSDEASCVTGRHGSDFAANIRTVLKDATRSFVPTASALRMTCLACLVIMAFADGTHADWWNDAWQCRRPVAFPAKMSAKVFEVTVPTHGLGRSTGTDVRVVSNGEEVPSRLVAAGPAHSVRVVFERRGTAPHFVYWNNPAAVYKPQATLRAGVLFEARSYDGSVVKNLGEMHARWAVGKSQGTRYVSSVHLGHNPLGPGTNFLSRFVGWFVAPTTGKYVFATDSDDASFLLVDGVLVTQWPGRHYASRRARHFGTIRLTAGMHRIEYLHAQTDGGLLMNAAWQPPGAKHPVVMPPGAFVPLERATVGRIELNDGGFVPDFLPTNVGQAVLNPDATDYLVKMHFENLAPADVLETHTTRWFFGDGTTSADVSPDHVYLKPGTYDVTLVMVKGYEEKKLAAKVHVARDWNRQPKAIDTRESYYDLIRTYDISRMKPRHAYLAMYYFGRVAKREDVIRAGKVILARENGLPEETLFDAVRLYAETMRVEGKDFNGARKMLVTYEKRMKHAEHAAALALAVGDIDMWHLKDLEAAEAAYRRVIFTYAEKARKLTLRRALVRMGDIHRWRHDGKRAREYLRKAQSIPVNNLGPVQKSVRAGYIARSIEELLQRGDMEFAYEYLLMWAWEYPEDQLDGYWTELRVKWLIKNKEYPGGIAEVESLLKMNPKTPYAAGLLWLAADCAEAAGDVKKTTELLERILTDYPEALNKNAVLKRLEALKK